MVSIIVRNPFDVQHQVLSVGQVVNPAVVCVGLAVQLTDVRFDIQQRCVVEHIQTGGIDAVPFNCQQPDNAETDRIGSHRRTAGKQANRSLSFGPGRRNQHPAWFGQTVDVVQQVEVGVGIQAVQPLHVGRIQLDIKQPLVLTFNLNRLVGGSGCQTVGGVDRTDLLQTERHRLLPDLAVAVDDEFGSGQILQTHRAEGVQLSGGDADLGSQTQLTAVIEAGGGIYQHAG